MSERLQSVLLDSNAYFRLAYSIHPLLKGSFGESPRYTLFVLVELDQEYGRNPRLKHKFHWVAGAAYAGDRKSKVFPVQRKKREDTDRALRFLSQYADEQKLNVSLIDLKALAHGFVYSVPVVTDDVNMAKVAEANAIECWSCIELLKLMRLEGRIDDNKVNEILEYWRYENDLPMPIEQLRSVFKEYFARDCPI